MFDGELKVIVQEPVCPETGLTRSRVYAELEAIANDLEAGKIKHLTEDEVDDIEYYGDLPEGAPAPALAFNMNYWCANVLNVLTESKACGSVCCIGGWFDLRTNTEIKYLLADDSNILTNDERRRLYNLFYSYGACGDPTPAEAAIEIRRFIAGGEPWCGEDSDNA